MRQLVALVAIRRCQLLEEPLDALLAASVAFDDELVALRADLDVEQRLDVLEVGVVSAVQRLDAFLRAAAIFFIRLLSVDDRDLEVQFPQLFRIDRRRRVRHQIHRRGGLRERNDLANRDSRSARMAAMRSRPSAMPPCGGVPYSSASRKKPKRELRLLLADVEQREDPALHRRHRGFGCCRRRSRCRSARDRTPWRAPCQDRCRACSKSSSCGEVNGWCIDDVALLLRVPLQQGKVHDPE